MYNDHTLERYALLLRRKRARLLFQQKHTVSFEVLAAELHDPRDLSVNGVEAELFVASLLPAAGRFCRHRQVERLQEPRLVIVKVGDAIHRYSALPGKNERQAVMDRHGLLTGGAPPHIEENTTNEQEIV